MANSAAFTGFVNNLIDCLNPGQISNILNTNGTWVGNVVSGINPSTVVDIVNNVNLTWYQALMTQLQAGALTIASFINARRPRTSSWP